MERGRLERIKKVLDRHLNPDLFKITEENPDPILIARTSPDDRVALVSALFAYGNVKAILKFLKNLEWERLSTPGPVYSYYRFQTREDVARFLDLLRDLGSSGIRELFEEGVRRGGVMEGLAHLISQFYRLANYDSPGFQFLIGKVPPAGRRRGVSPYKRWNMFLRWMVRTGEPDLGRWRFFSPSQLLVPLDVHTHRTALRLGLLTRKSYDLEAVWQLTETLRQLDPIDPIKYDFLLYRIGQQGWTERFLFLIERGELF